MPSYRVKTTIPPDHRLVLDLPEELPAGEAEVEVRVGEPAGGKGKALADYLAELRRDPNRPTRSKEEIDRYLQEERDSWG